MFDPPVCVCAFSGAVLLWQDSVWGETTPQQVLQSNHTSLQQQQQQRFETVTSGKKKKKQKMVRADPSLLGKPHDCSLLHGNVLWVIDSDVLFRHGASFINADAFTEVADNVHILF